MNNKLFADMLELDDNEIYPHRHKPMKYFTINCDATCQKSLHTRSH